ncbi:MAG TPA: flagellar biosynthesis protein FlhB, partial [Rhodospirillaceae bacterium]|nr:flagellar biosynthesis protein FlhB [Rhodospirillaceae bacterium]
MAEDDDSKSEQPTDRRLGRARDDGDIPQSQEIKTVAMLIAITVFVWLIAPVAMGRISRLLAGVLEHLDSIRVGSDLEMAEVLGHLALNVSLVMILPLGFLLVVGLSSAVGQTGWTVSTKKLTPDLNKLNPMTGLGRMFSLTSVMELVKSLAKLGVVGAVSYMVMSPRLKELVLLPSMEAPAILAYIHDTLIVLLMAIVMVMVVIAAADWAYQRFSYFKKLRMTKQEVKDEHKQTEGDPMIKSRLRMLRMQRARN